MRRFWTGIALILCLASCGQSEQQSAVRTFPVISIPGIYADDPQEAMEYAADHYWDEFTDTSSRFVCDTALVNGVPRAEVEQQVVGWIALLHQMDIGKAQNSVRRLYHRVEAYQRADTSSNVFETITEMVSRHLYDPNSPLRDEDLYLPYARLLSGYSGFSPVKRSVYEYEALMCSLNSVGTKAADFTFTDALGRERDLYDIKADYVLLFFTNPGCTACADITEKLTGELMVGEMIASGHLAVVNIYIDDDYGQWRSHLSDYPDDWYSGYDARGVIRNGNLYNVRAIPSLYLLDRDKVVILKDAPQERIFTALDNIR